MKFQVSGFKFQEIILNSSLFTFHSSLFNFSLVLSEVSSPDTACIAPQ